MYYILLMHKGFVKIMFFATLEEQEAVVQFLLNVRLIIVIYCFWVLGSAKCTAFRKNDV